MAKATYQIPFDKNGGMIRKVYNYGSSALFVFKDNFVFEDILQYTGMQRTSTSSYALFKSTTTKKTFYMFLKDLDKVLLKHTVKLGFLSGKFTFCKHGPSYGIKIISSDPLTVMT